MGGVMGWGCGWCDGEGVGGVMGWGCGWCDGVGVWVV